MYAATNDRVQSTSKWPPNSRLSLEKALQGNIKVKILKKFCERIVSEGLLVPLVPYNMKYSYIMCL